MNRTAILLVGAAVAGALAASPAIARDTIRIVGSSTVYPFSTVVAEAFGRSTDFLTPVIESTGTGGGFALFCAGVGEEHPDFSNASRAIKHSEIDLCAGNGVTEIVEMKIGYDGIVLVNSREADPIEITRAQLWLALAREVPNAEGDLVLNPHQTWAEIDPALPDAAIEVLGPPPTSGTRDAFVELVMEVGCETFPAVAALEAVDEGRFEQMCASMREDGRYIEVGENDVLIVRRLESSPDAFGILGYSFLDQNADVIQGARIEGAEPTFDNILAGDYPVSRPLFVYAKAQHVGIVDGMEEFIREFTDDRVWGPDGYLADRGLIPMPDAERERYRTEARALTANLM